MSSKVSIVFYREKLPDDMSAEVLGEADNIHEAASEFFNEFNFEFYIRLIDEDSEMVVDKKIGYKSLDEAKAAIDKYYKPDGKPISIAFLPDMKRDIKRLYESSK